MSALTGFSGCAADGERQPVGGGSLAPFGAPASNLLPKAPPRPPTALDCDGIDGVDIVFPPCNSLATFPDITVRGRTSGLDVAAIRVNGAPATTSDGFRQWRAPVTLDHGDNPITVEVETVDGAVIAGAALSVTYYDPVMESPAGLVVDAERNRALVSEDSDPVVHAVDLAGGRVTTFADNPFGTSSQQGGLHDIALDPARNRLLVVSAGNSDVGALDLDTGAFSPIAPNTPDHGPVTGVIQHIAVSAADDRGYLYDHQSDVIYALDLDTGQRAVACTDSPGADLVPDGSGRLLVANRTPFADTIGAVDLSSCAVTPGPGGPLLGQIWAMALDGDGGRLAVLELDEWYQRIAVIDLQTGAVEHTDNLSEHPRDVLLPSASATELAWWDDGSPAGRVLLTAEETSALLALDPVTETLAPVSGAFIGGGATYTDSLALVADTERGHYLVMTLYQGLMIVDMVTGERRHYGDLLRGGGQGLDSPGFAHAMVLDPDGDRLFAVDGSYQLVQFDLEAGERSDITPPGVTLGPSPAIAWDPDRQRLYVMTAQLLVTYDAATGAALQVPIALAGNPIAAGWDPVRQRVLVGTSASPGLFAIDIASGAVSLVTLFGLTPTVGSRPVGIAVDPDRGRAIVEMQVFGNVLLNEVVLQTGAYARVASSSVGQGPVRCSAGELALIERGEVAVTDCDWFVLAADLATGDRVYVSR